MRAIAFAAIVCLALGCMSKIGPGEFGWAAWDWCGFEGGVALSVEVMGNKGRFGCTDPPKQGDSAATLEHVEVIESEIEAMKGSLP